MGQFMLLNCFVSFSLDDSMSKAESKSRLLTPDDSHSMKKTCISGALQVSLIKISIYLFDVWPVESRGGFSLVLVHLQLELKY